ncbi:hypothetical protein [Lactobacillus helveticus]|uniref:hypothetical protein n=1 Tax=Lactobacillus helveticus TaxID=1587 RepID=UPI00062A9B86|nr:hypothetical protein [Lactobacillus helveticus]AKG66661.1 hypothetical protein TU99_04925 [Lactobacillus helveticus]
MSLDELFVQMWIIDYQMKWAPFDTPEYFKGLVKQGLLNADGYKRIVGEDYVAPQIQPTQPITASTTQSTQTQQTAPVTQSEQ